MPLDPPSQIKVEASYDEPTIVTSFRMPIGTMFVQLRLSPSGRVLVVRSPHVMVVTPGTYTVELRSVYKAGYSVWVATVVTVQTQQCPSVPGLTLAADPSGCGVVLTLSAGNITGPRDSYFVEVLDANGIWVPWRGPITGRLPRILKEPDAKCRTYCFRAYAYNVRCHGLRATRSAIVCGSFPSGAAGAPLLTLVANQEPCAVRLDWTAGTPPCGLNWGLWEVVLNGLTLLPGLLPGEYRSALVTGLVPGVSTLFTLTGYVRHAESHTGGCFKSLSVTSSALECPVPPPALPPKPGLA